MAGVTEHLAPRVPWANSTSTLHSVYPGHSSLLQPGCSSLLPGFGLQPAPPLLWLQTFSEDARESSEGPQGSQRGWDLGGGNRRVINTEGCQATICAPGGTPAAQGPSLTACQLNSPDLGLCLGAMFYSNLMVASSLLAVTVPTSQSAFSHPPSMSSPMQVPALSHLKTASLEASSPPGSHLFPMVSQTP